MAGKPRTPSRAKEKETADNPLPNVNAAASSHDVPTASLPFPIVCVGASAGGLHAVTQMLRSLPPDTGMAFVVVQHLDPHHPSMLTEILARETRMSVMQVIHHAAVQPDHVYVIPPGKNMLIAHGHLELSPRTQIRGQHMPIDHFMRSLAEEQGFKAIGIVLSGSSSDGTLGMQEIKAAGGITFAQDDSAEQTSMPRSAVAAGCVDFILSPTKIGEELGRISRHPYVSAAQANENIAPPRSGFTEIIDLLRQAKNVDFSNYKRNTLHRRITRRMVLHRLDGLPEYLRLLKGDPAETEALYQDILISVTSFFRNAEAYEVLKSRVFPRLLASRSRHEPLRAWVLGCSTGEEAYSIAMAYVEFAEEHSNRVPVQIFATDLNGLGIDKARAGIYTKGITQDVSPERLRRFFVEIDGSYRIAKSIRDMCVFARQNVLADPPFSRLDLVACRNMLIYLEPVLQQRLLPTLHYALRNDGCLWLGTSETIGGYRDLFAVEDPKFKFYRRIPGPARIMTIPTGAHNIEPRRAARVEETRGPAAGTGDPQREADRVLLARYAPPGVVVNAEFDIVQFRGDTGPYLTPSPGRASLNLLKMLREGLLVAVRSALHKVGRTGVAVTEAGLRVKSNGGFRELNVRVLPMNGGTGAGGHALVLFEEPGRVVATHKGGSARSGKQAGRRVAKDSEKEVLRLEQELEALREYLQSIIEHQEAANEELQSANEEVQSTNEELQSTNEELETSKEEIQASNEELSALNDELQDRNLEVSQSNNDLVNLLSSVQMAIIMLSPNLRIRRFTPTAEKLLNLIHTDIGRPITDFKFKLDFDDLEQVLIDVIDNVKVVERTVKDRTGRWFSMRIRPYRTLDNKIDGAVIVLVDIDTMQRARDILAESETRFRLLANSAPVPIWLREADGSSFVNRAYREFLGLTEEQAPGHDWSQYVHPDDHASYTAVHMEATARRAPFERQFRFRRADGEYRWMKSVATPRFSAAGEFLGYVGCTFDIQELKDAENVLVDADRRKNEFLSTLSHELRNPLAAISSAVQVMQMDKADRGIVKEAGSIMERQTQHMVRMVNDLLDVTRITRGSVHLRKKPAGLAEVVTQAIASTEHLRNAKEQKLEAELPKDSLCVLGDTIRLEQVVANLLSNASKFSPAGSTMHVTVTEDRPAGGTPCALIRVRDEGIGITPELLPKIFEMFVHAPESHTGTEGFGIGLALARQLVELHNGTIEAVSAGPGAGSELIVRLPLCEAPVETAAAAEPRKSNPRRILVVDDNESLGKILSIGLRHDGHVVAITRDPRAALDTVREFKPDVVLLDIGMPGMDGYEVARQLRKALPEKAPLLIAMTGYAQAEDIRRAMNAGFDMHLRKPVDHHELHRIVADSPSRHEDD